MCQLQPVWPLKYIYLCVAEDQFDIKEFHDICLSCGQVPMDILEQIVDRYIQNNNTAELYDWQYFSSVGISHGKVNIMNASRVDCIHDQVQQVQ